MGKFQVYRIAALWITYRWYRNTLFCLTATWFCFIGSAFGTRENRRLTYKGKVNFHAGKNKIALLSVAVGLPVSSFPLTLHIFDFNNQIMPIIPFVFVFAECWRTLRDMEHWSIRPSCIAWTWPGKTGLVLGEMDVPGSYLIYLFHKYKTVYLLSHSFYKLLTNSCSAGRTEGRSHECDFSRWYFLCWLVAGLIDCTKTTAFNVA